MPWDFLLQRGRGVGTAIFRQDKQLVLDAAGFIMLVRDGGLSYWWLDVEVLRNGRARGPDACRPEIELQAASISAVIINLNVSACCFFWGLRSMLGWV